MKQPHTFTDNTGSVLILRRVDKSRKSHGGYVYPPQGSTITAPDWNSRQECGGGFHGWPFSFGLGEGSDFDIINDVWQILAAKPEDVVGELDRGWKCKCREAVIRHEGTFAEMMAVIKPWLHKCTVEMAASSGNSATNDAAGRKSVCAAAGFGSRVRMADGGAFALSYLDGEQPRFICGVIGENGVKPNTWYEVRDGRLAEVANQ